MEQVGENMHSFEENSFYNFGQKFYIINQETFANLKQLREFDKVYIDNILIERINILLEFTNNHEEFCCAITKARMGRKRYFWFPMLFYKKCFSWIRVRIETTKCLVCGWQGSIANPTLPDLYETLDNKFELMKVATQIETIPCPNCNSLLRRHAIWVESSRKDGGWRDHLRPELYL